MCTLTAKPEILHTKRPGLSVASASSSALAAPCAREARAEMGRCSCCCCCWPMVGALAGVAATLPERHTITIPRQDPKMIKIIYEGLHKHIHKQ